MDVFTEFVDRLKPMLVTRGNSIFVTFNHGQWQGKHTLAGGRDFLEFTLLELRESVETARERLAENLRAAAEQLSKVDGAVVPDDLPF